MLSCLEKDRSRRYRSTSDLLIDLEAVSEGQAPPQAHKQMDAGTLAMLEQGRAGEATVREANPAGKLLIYVVILAAALLISLIVNIVLIAHD